MGDTYTRQSSYTDGDVITAAHTNNEFNQLLAAFAASTGHTHDGTAAEGGPITKLLGNTLTFGAGTAGTDITITFDGETSDGELKWMEDEDYFEFSDDILIASTEKIQFGDTASFIQQSSDGVLRIDGEATVDINASTAVTISNDLKLDSDSAVLGFGADNDVTLTHVADTALLLNSSRQLQFGDSGTYIHQSADGVLDLVADTEIEINATTIDINGNVDISGTLTIGSADISETELEILDGATVTTTELNILDGDTTASSTTVADADRVVFNDAGTMKQVAVTDLAAYFDDEITAMPNLTSVGTLTTLTVDNVIINGSTIGHTGDTDLMTVASGVLTVAGEVDATSLDISGDADIDGTLEADAITVNGTALNTVIAGVTVTDATNSAHVLVTDNESTNEENLITFVEDATSSTGNVGLEMDGNLTYNPSTGTVTATVFKGNIDAVDGDFDGTLEADAITLDGTAITATATLDTGISNNNVPKFTSGVADNDFLRVDGTAIEGRSASEVLSDIAAAPAAGDSNIVTTGALNSGSITSGFGAINNGSSAITTTGTMTFGSLSDGSITVTAFVDEDDMSSDSATLIPTQQSVKAFVEANAGSFNSFFIEDDDGTEVTIDNAKELKFIGSGITTNFTDTSTGSDGDPFDLTFTVDAAQTGITSILATDLKIGEDDQTKIDFETADEIHFYAANAEQVFVSDGVFGPQTDSDVDLGTTGARFKDAYVDSVTITGAFTAGDQCVITSANNVSQLVLKSTDADGSLGPKLDLVRDSSSPADNDNCGQINFFIDNDAGQSIQYGDIFVGAIDVSDSTESGHMTFSTMKGGSRASRMKIHPDETVFNEDSFGTIDFRVESDSFTHMLFVDSSTNRLGLATSTPQAGYDQRAGLNGNSQFLIDASTTGGSGAGGAFLKFMGSNGTAEQIAGIDGSMVDGTDGGEDGILAFFTMENGTSSERIRILQDGDVLLHQNSTDQPGLGNTTTGMSFRSDNIVAISSASGYFAINRNSDGTIQQWSKSGNAKGSVTIGASGIIFATTSDGRLKQDIEPLKATDKLMAMNPVSYAWKENPDGPRSMGFIAQEMQEIMPDAVSIGEDDDATMQMDYGRITPILVSALQDAHKKIEELESRIEAMESK